MSNNNSYICRYIDTYKNWRELLENDFGLDISDNKDYSIFRYTNRSNLLNPLVREANSIIIDTNKNEIVCWPLRKIGNWDDVYADIIDWSSAVVEEKVHGYVVKLWYDKINDKWSFYNKDGINEDIIKTADNYSNIHFERLLRSMTYIFVLSLSPSEHLFHVGTKSNMTGTECTIDLGIDKPKVFPYHDLNECFKHLTKDGFIVTDKDWHRIKVVKQEKFHGRLTKRDIINTLLGSNENFNYLCQKHPNYRIQFEYYRFKIEELIYKSDIYIEFVRDLYNKNGNNKEKIKELTKNDELYCIGIKALDNNLTSIQIIKDMNINKICYLIETFKSYKPKLKA